MTIDMGTPGTGQLSAVLDTLAAWQFDGAPFQLHPGDVGWFWRHGAEATAAALRTWSQDDQVLAIGLLDETDLLRLAIDPDLHADAELARQLVTDIADPGRGVLGPGKVDLEIARGVHLHEVLDEAAWSRVNPWPVMRHDLSSVEEHGLRIEVIEDDRAHVWAHVHGAAWGGKPSDEGAILGRWHQMASGPAFASARCLVGFDQDDRPVATVTVWSAGVGRHGIVEPMGVHAEHRGRGHGHDMNVAAAAALQELGCSAAFVCTPGSNTGAVAAYQSAGFEMLYERFDRRREA